MQVGFCDCSLQKKIKVVFSLTYDLRPKKQSKIQTSRLLRDNYRKQDTLPFIDVMSLFTREVQQIKHFDGHAINPRYKTQEEMLKKELTTYM